LWILASDVGRGAALFDEQAVLEYPVVAAEWVLAEVLGWHAVVAASSLAEMVEYHVVAAAVLLACSELPARPGVYSSLYPEGSLSLFQSDCVAARP
jgi:hypothetical protein